MASELPTSATTDSAPSADFLSFTEPPGVWVRPGAGFAWLPTRRSDQFSRVDQCLPITPLLYPCPNPGELRSVTKTSMTTTQRETKWSHASVSEITPRP